MKKSKRVPRKRRETPDPLSFVDLHVRMRHGEAIALAEFLKRREIEWFSLRCLKEPLKKAGIKLPGGWL
jgi:hypothetical protein